MIPAWVWSILVVTIGCIAALILGSYLPDTGFDPIITLGLVFFTALCVLCAIYNNFPFLLALGSWIPFFPHIFASFPTIAYFLAWMAVVLFFRLCLQGYLSYRQSFTWSLLFIFAWVPVRFLMNPVTKLGSNAGGTGVSGAMPYFNYCLAACLMIFLGAVLNDRSKITYFMRWCGVVVYWSGMALLICAFIPATAPYLIAMGSFAAGNITEGVQRLVQLPGYGLFLVEVALCPALFRFRLRIFFGTRMAPLSVLGSFWTSAFLFVLGLVMIIVGGNRSALAAAVIVIPLILFLRRRSHATILSLALMAVLVVGLHFTVSSMNGDVPTLFRGLGALDPSIDKATGGDSSANWRYAVWDDGIKKIMEAPLTGKGFGNLPQHVESSDAEKSQDFETVLAGGLSHNGFINAAYGFGIPFSVALTVAIVVYFFKEAYLALRADKHDPEMQDLHAFLAAMFASYLLLIYSAFDLSSISVWIYVAMSCVLSHLPKQELLQSPDAGMPLRKYGEEPRPAGQYSYRPR